MNVINIYVFMHIIGIGVCVCVRVCKDVCVCVRMYACMYICTYIYIPIYTHTYIYIYAHTHIHNSTFVVILNSWLKQPIGFRLRTSELPTKFGCLVRSQMSSQLVGVKIWESAKSEPEALKPLSLPLHHQLSCDLALQEYEFVNNPEA